MDGPLIPIDMLCPAPCAYGADRFDIDASDLGLRPGQWPPALAADRLFGNGEDFVRVRWFEQGGRTAGVLYRQNLGTTEIRIFND